MDGLIALEVVYQQLDVVQADLKRARAEVDSRLSAETARDELNISKARAQTATEEEDTSRSQADEALAALGAHKRLEEEWRVAFLLSKGFQQVVVDKTYSYFQIDFNKFKK